MATFNFRGRSFQLPDAGRTTPRRTSSLVPSPTPLAQQEEQTPSPFLLLVLGLFPLRVLGKDFCNLYLLIILLQEKLLILLPMSLHLQELLNKVLLLLHLILLKEIHN